jgi:hypothetical protein
MFLNLRQNNYKFIIILSIIILFIIISSFYYKTNKDNNKDNNNDNNDNNDNNNKNNNKSNNEQFTVVSSTLLVGDTTYKIINPPEANRTFSSCYGGDGTGCIVSGSNHRLSMIDTQQGWSSSSPDTTNSWIQMDLGGSPPTISGIVMQGRGDSALQFVLSYNVSYSNDNTNFKTMDNTFVNDTTATSSNGFTPTKYTTDYNTKFGKIFTDPITARYIRIIPKSYYNWMTLRVGVLETPTLLVGGTTYNIINPPTANRKFSSCYKDGLNNTNLNCTTIPGLDFRLSAIDSTQWWASNSSNTSDNSNWIQMDLGSSPPVVSGIVMQGRGDAQQFVTSYNVRYSNDDSNDDKFTTKDGTFVNDDITNPTIYTRDLNTKFGKIFTSPITARYIRIIPKSFHNWVSLRVGVLVLPTTQTTTPYVPTTTPYVPTTTPYVPTTTPYVPTTTPYVPTTTQYKPTTTPYVPTTTPYVPTTTPYVPTTTQYKPTTTPYVPTTTPYVPTTTPYVPTTTPYVPTTTPYDTYTLSYDITTTQTTRPITTQQTTTRPTTTGPITTQPTTTIPTTTKNQSTTTQPTTTQPTTTQSQPTTTQDQLLQQMPAIGPCSRVEITANNINLAGILILDQYGNNIFNNNYVKSNLSDINGTYSSSPDELRISRDLWSNLFKQTYNIVIEDGASCDFDSNNTDSYNPNMYMLKCTNTNTNRISNYPIDKTQIFSPLNTESLTSTISVDIPQTANNNPLPPNISISNISRIVLCLNNQIDNTIMINSLNIRVYGLDNSIIAKWNVSQTIDPATNFLTFILPSSYPTTTTQSNVDNFVNIKNNKLKFADVVANPADVVFDNLLLVPITTNQPMTTPQSTISRKPTSTYENDILQNNRYLSPSTKIYQHNFNGTSNVYSPVIYYIMEQFVPLTSLDEYYAPY